MASLVLVCFMVLGVAFLFLDRNILGNERRETMAETAQELAGTIAVYADLDVPDSEAAASWPRMDLRILLSNVSRTSGFRILLTDAGGSIVSCSDPPNTCTHVGHAIRQEALQGILMAGNRGMVVNFDALFDSAMLVVAAPIVSEGQDEVSGCVLVLAEEKYISGAWHSFRQLFFFMALVVMLIAFVMSFIASKRMAKPLNEMAAASRRFAHGDFSARVEIESRDDELGALTMSFNAMAESLEKSEERRREFLGNVSHELRTPMTTIAGFADGILDGTIPPENQQKYLQVISTETKRLSRLVRRMLDLARLQDADKLVLLSREFDAREMLTRTLLSFEDKITARSLDADVRIPEENVPVRGDVDAIEQVVYNLLENAVKFSEPGSTLGIALWKQGDKACISVKNHGETIDARELSRVFDRFHKTDHSRSRDRDGVGLGLYIVKSILNNHDEDIFVTSRDGVTEFVFTLSLKEKARS
ncbi:MAG: HAMP domain-containing protein [Oscillospiraceae bacterium]|nr:HAMP domain-containing protein [Oscillospiraceae bacterium]